MVWKGPVELSRCGLDSCPDEELTQSEGVTRSEDAMLLDIRTLVLDCFEFKFRTLSLLPFVEIKDSIIL